MVTTTPASLRQLDPEPTPVLPYVIHADAPGTPVAAALPAVRDLVRRRLRERGAVLLRGFAVGGADPFGHTVTELAGDPLTYAERSSPRTTIKGNIYTSTDYPATEEIFLHNENSYQLTWPLTVAFCCLQPPATLGATPLADTRQVWRGIDPAVRDEFAARGWMVVRNFTDGFGVPWQQAFGTGDRAGVERYCARNGMRATWVGANGLRTEAGRRAVHRHPGTGEQVWFNHITFFHVTTLPAEIRTGLRELFDDAELPTNTYYGDGGPIPDDVVAHLRDCYAAARQRFDWRLDDVLLVDNMLAAHGRERFTGQRTIAVAMAEPHSAHVTR